tara:strand:+ start:374 stop:529 length:156 start_codon:yes stop_codon:yes gene_type:complete
LEWFRHNLQCTTLWLDSHVTSIKFNGFNRGIDYRFYTGRFDQPANPQTFLQ